MHALPAPPPEALFDLYTELRRYVNLSDEELRRAPEIWSILEDSAASLIDDFYDEILRHPEASRVLQGESQVARLKSTLMKWLSELFAGPYDGDFVSRRWQVGYRHVQIGLPSIWVSVAMSRLREGAIAVIRQKAKPQSTADYASIASKMMDVDLSLIQDAYNSELFARQQNRERDFAEGVIQTAQAVVLLVDRQGVIIRANTFLSQLLGWTPSTATNLRFSDLIAPSDRESLEQFLASVLSDTPSTSLETDLFPASGPPRRIRWLARPYNPPDQSIIVARNQPAPSRLNPQSPNPQIPEAPNPWVLCVGQDITDLTEAQRQLVRHARLAAIGQTMTGLAHESRNAFQRSQAALETLLLELEDRPVAVELIERIQRAHDHLLHLYEEVLQFARPVRLEIQSINLESVLRQTWEHLSVVVSPKRLKLEITSHPDALHLQADPFAIEQVLRNLLENAAEASSQDGAITVNIYPSWIGTSAATSVEIRDCGKGIPPHQMERIFEPFFTTRPRGTGLGLPIARRLAEGHGGSLCLQDADPGVCAMLVLPQVATPDPEVQIASEDTRRTEQ